MGAFADYIAGIQNRTDLDIEAVVADLSRIHDEEFGTVNGLLTSANAKIETLSTEIATGVEKLAESQAEITRVKTANYDLIMSHGINNDNAAPEGERVIDDTNITPDDLFASNEG